VKARLAMCLLVALVLTGLANRADAISCSAGTGCFSPNCTNCINAPQGSDCQPEWSSASCGCGWSGGWDDPAFCWDVGSCQYGPCYMADAIDPAGATVRLASVCWPWEPRRHTRPIIRDTIKLAPFPGRTVLGYTLGS
jgi:hypothetical protein